MANIRVVRTIGELRLILANEEVSFVPTMGSLHDGHAALINAAAGDHLTTVVSVFVNPTQFDSADDLARYPRDLDADIDLAEMAGCDVVFAPSVAEMYPAGDATRVQVSSVAIGYEGKHRPGHFEGVATVVAKLFLIVQPNSAWFGEKDWQQCCVVSRMVADLHMPIELRFAPTVREPNGLAMSSRNALLNPAQRENAGLIFECLTRAASDARDGEDLPSIEAAATKALIDAGFGVDYFAFVDPLAMTPATAVEGSRIIAAASIAGVRLIDNIAV